MKSRLISIIIITAALFSGLSLHAETITQKQAKKLASTFFNAANEKVMGEPRYVWNGKKLTTDRLFTPFYVFNFSSGGYVIVAADNKAFPILSYSLTENFNPDDIPAEMMNLLKEYARDIEYIRYDSRFPWEAEEAWTYFNDYTAKEVLASFQYVNPSYVPEELDATYSGQRGDFYTFQFGDKEYPSRYWLLKATEYINTGLYSLIDSKPYEEEEIEEEEEPFTFYNKIKEDELADVARKEEEYTRSISIVEPVVQTLGNGRYAFVLPDAPVYARVFNLDGQQVEYYSYGEGADRAFIDLMAHKKGFYFIQVVDSKGVPHGFKVTR